MMFKHVIPISKLYLVIVIVIFITICLIFIVTFVVVTVDNYKFLSFYLSVFDTQSVMIICILTHPPI